ncbi:enolase C-terminal domain-like protein [Sphingomonas sp. G-3-2-10]|uniref:enolase C-terminal domain-like protein n=1 Tax=Sphingomonas sp. G-3-2-10 TaxID=2728838 RepID=UPI00146E678A|nr:enolase C-terminal domain-like protein [Sphingomonas sp. G-3-2-10]NML08172.1 hypothetical protein [Sphingomonas sp. G-3-2-10]
MKLVSVEMLRQPPAPPPATPAGVPRKVAGGVPFPIHRYPEFARTPATTPGEVSGEFWVRVTAENGETGLGHSHWGDLAAPTVRFFANLIEGRDCFATELLNDLMWRSAQRFGANGIASLARSAIDLALWDLKGKLLGQPVWRLLGGPVRPHLDCYFTGADIEWGRELGFKAFKMRNSAHHVDGIAGLNRLEDEVAAVRSRIGDEAELMLNPVMSFTLDYAVRVAERLAPYRLRWIEEPLMPHDIDGLVALKRAAPFTPIATGEDHHGRHAFRELVQRGAADIVQPDIRWAGGLTETLKIYAIAEAAGVATSAHGGGGMPAGQHFSLALPETEPCEYVVRTPAGVPLDQAKRIPGMATPVDGRIVPSDAPGFGYEFGKDAFLSW